jgi:hypothetical protein
MPVNRDQYDDNAFPQTNKQLPIKISNKLANIIYEDQSCVGVTAVHN